MTDLLRRIERFIAAGRGDFDELAAEAARFGCERIEPYRRLCERRGISHAELNDWQAAPPVPTSAFKSLRLAAAEPREVFRSSGTTRGAERRSIHYHPYPDLYRTVIDATFADACLSAGAGRVPILSLIPDRDAAPDSSLSFMADHVFGHHASPGSAWAVARNGIDVEQASHWLQSHDGGEPVLILTTALALVLLLDHLEGRTAYAIRLPAGSRVFETGGFKGQRLETAPEDIRRRARSLLGLDPEAVVREYGMTELTSQAYSRPGGERLRTPPWMPFRVLDPESLEEVEHGEPGLLAFFDLANLGSVCHVLTEDLGVREGDAFHLLGRATGAELRGCSLTAEELGAA